MPQQTDGAAFHQRRAAYRELLATAGAWAVSSRHERALVHEHLRPADDGLVAPLPVITPMIATNQTPPAIPCWPAGRTAAVFGFVYPGKGHAELIEAAARIRAVVEVTVMALGAVAPGHDDLVVELGDRAREAGVGFLVTGHLDQAEKAALLRRVDVGVCGHRNVSASGPSSGTSPST